MIKLTKLEGGEMYINPDLIESMEMTPETRVTLTNGDRFLVVEQVWTIVERIVSYRARIMRRASPCRTKRYLMRRLEESYRPYCRLGSRGEH